MPSAKTFHDESALTIRKGTITSACASREGDRMLRTPAHDARARVAVTTPMTAILARFGHAEGAAVYACGVGASDRVAPLFVCIEMPSATCTASRDALVAVCASPSRSA